MSRQTNTPDERLAQECPMWIEAVEDRVTAINAGHVFEEPISTQISSFGDAELLYTAIDYASNRGVPVLITPVA